LGFGAGQDIVELRRELPHRTWNRDANHVGNRPFRHRLQQEVNRGRHHTQHNDIQRNDTQHNNKNVKLCISITQHKKTTHSWYFPECGVFYCYAEYDCSECGHAACRVR
jgi:hypothetical protein